MSRTNRSPNKSMFKTLPKLLGATKNQELAIGFLREKNVTILEGLAGTGKTYLAIHTALSKLLSREISRVILTRPLINVGNEKLGFLPGELNDKIGPYAAQFIEYMEEFLPVLGLSQEDNTFMQGIEFVPLGYIRGRNFANSIIILDEAQNTTPLQMKTLLTRAAKDTQVFVLGDTKQSDYDLSSHTKNGLTDLLSRVYAHPSDYFGHVTFGVEDIQRSELAKHLMVMYEEI